MSITIDNMLYTLDYLEQEAKDILGSWNGSDEKFVDTTGEVRTEDDINNAADLLETITKVRELAKELGI